MKTKNKVNKSGFTLIELLIVVLIIGILTRAALPMYKKAAEKSRVADALNTMQAVVTSEHDFFLTKNNYTQDFADLNIELTDKDGNKAEDESFESNNYVFTLQDNSIKATRKNGEYTLYKTYDNLGTVYCTPSDHYICQQFNWLDYGEKCNSMGGYWAYTNGTCYASEQERCQGLGNNWNGTFCGYTNEKGKTLHEGEECRNSGIGYAGVGNGSYEEQRENAKGSSCGGSIIKNGGICQGTASNAGGTYVAGGCSGTIVEKGGTCNGYRGGTCSYSVIYGVCNAETQTSAYHGSCGRNIIKQGGVCNGNDVSGCSGSTIEKGGTCVGNAAKTQIYSGSCTNITVQAGGKCVANAYGTCIGTYEGTGKESGCCEGSNCPSTAPRCECPNHEKKDSNGNCITA